MRVNRDFIYENGKCVNEMVTYKYNKAEVYKDLQYLRG